MPPFSLAEVVTRWQFAPIITAFAVIAAGLYLWGVLRVRRRHPARPWPLHRTALFLGGLAVVVIATQSGIGSYDDVLFWDHMVQHLLLLMVAPPLLVVGQPATLLLHASRNPLHTWAKKVLRSRVLAAITWPPFGVALYVGVIVGTHLTGFMNLVETNSGIHDAEHALYLISGYLYFLPLIGREPIRWRLALLALIGYGPGWLVLLPLVQAALLALAGSGLAVLLFEAAAGTIGLIFPAIGGTVGATCRLDAAQLLVVSGATTALCVAASSVAAARVARLEPATMIRDS